MRHIKAILFDKDGTLFDFQATWGAWADALLTELSQGNEALKNRLAEAILFDPSTHRFNPRSPIIAGTGSEAADILARFLPSVSKPALETQIARAARAAPLHEAVPLRDLLTRLKTAGYALGVATNDYEIVARDHIAPIADLFDFIAGFDSGYGGKPEPGMLLAFSAQCQVKPSDVLMVGDSRHDLIAGHAAGMATLAVLTGVAEASELADLADEIRPNIGHLPDLLGLA